MIFRTGTTADIDQILLLQQTYLLTNIPESERSEGFVTTPFTIEQLTFIIEFKGCFVAETEKRIIAYVVACSWDFFCQWPIFAYMVTRLPELRFEGLQPDTRNSFEYGPICIDKNYRNSNVLPNIFETMRMGMQKKFPIGVTFINKQNKRSFSAHTKKLNLKVIDEFGFNGHEYYTLAFRTDQSVLK